MSLSSLSPIGLLSLSSSIELFPGSSSLLLSGRLLSRTPDWPGQDMWPLSPSSLAFVCVLLIPLFWVFRLVLVVLTLVDKVLMIVVYAFCSAGASRSCVDKQHVAVWLASCCAATACTLVDKQRLWEGNISNVNYQSRQTMSSGCIITETRYGDFFFGRWKGGCGIYVARYRDFVNLGWNVAFFVWISHKVCCGGFFLCLLAGVLTVSGIISSGGGVSFVYHH